MKMNLIIYINFDKNKNRFLKICKYYYEKFNKMSIKDDLEIF